MSLQDKKIQDLFEATKDYTLKVRNKKTDPSQEGTYIETNGFSGWFYAHKSSGNKRTIAHIIKENKLLLLFKFQKDHKKLVKDKSKRELFMQVIELSDDELVWQLLSLGYSFDQSIGCLSYIEKKTINCAIDFFEKNEN